MATMVLYNFKTKKKMDLPVSDHVFALNVNPAVITQAVLYHRAVCQTGLAQAKTRGEVQGGGRKPWRQKGTGRARQGSIRSPIWKGGGVVFGPRKHLVEQRLPKKMRRRAIAGLLSSRLAQGKLWAYENLELALPKTKVVVDILKQLPAYKNVLIVAYQKDDMVKLATRNLPTVHFIEEQFPSVTDILSSDFILLHKDIVKNLEEKYGSRAAQKKATITEIGQQEVKKTETESSRATSAESGKLPVVGKVEQPAKKEVVSKRSIKSTSATSKSVKNKSSKK